MIWLELRNLTCENKNTIWKDAVQTIKWKMQMKANQKCLFYLLEVSMDQSNCPTCIITPWSNCLCQICIPDKHIFVRHFLPVRGKDILLQALHKRICVTIEEIFCEINTWQKLFVPESEFKLQRRNWNKNLYIQTKMKVTSRSIIS